MLAAFTKLSPVLAELAEIATLAKLAELEVLSELIALAELDLLLTLRFTLIHFRIYHSDIAFNI